MVTALNECFCLSRGQGDQPLPIAVSVGKPGLDPEENKEEVKEEVEEGEDNQDEPAKLAKSAVVGEKLSVLLQGYTVSEGRSTYNGSGTKLQNYSQTQK